MNFSALDGFEWDEGNLKKVLQRMEAGVAEMAFQGTPLVAKAKKFSSFEKRFYLVNKVTGRYVFLVFTVRREKIRIISARYMHRREAKHYEKIFQKEEGHRE